MGKITIDWSTGLIFSMFDGSWPMLGGQLVRAEFLYGDEEGYESSRQIFNDYGYSRTGSFDRGNGATEEILVKSCGYDAGERKFTDWNGSSEAFSITFLADGSVQWTQYVTSGEVRDKVFDSLKKDGFSLEQFAEGKYHLWNACTGIDCQLVGKAWTLTSTISGAEDYPFIKASTISAAKSLTDNTILTEQTYRNKRFKFCGTVTELTSSDFPPQARYSFDEAGAFFLYVPMEDASYDISLPKKLCFSGFIREASSTSLTMENVRIYDPDNKKYIGPSKPRYKTATLLEGFRESSGQDADNREINYPLVSNKGNNGLTVKKIVASEKETVIYFNSDARIPGTSSYNEWCSVSPDAGIIVKGKKYRLNRAEGIAISPDMTTYPTGSMSLDFSLHFPPIPHDARTIDFVESEDSPWNMKGIQLTVPQSRAKPDYSFTGYLTNGKNNYNIEMVLYCVDGYQYKGYYRYLSQPEDKRINLSGELGSSLGAFSSTQLILFSEEKTELFQLSIDGKKAEGIWHKYDSADDCEMCNDNYTKSLDVVMTVKD